jgi:hypothetical protein
LLGLKKPRFSGAFELILIVVRDATHRISRKRVKNPHFLPKPHAIRLDRATRNIRTLMC